MSNAGILSKLRSQCVGTKGEDLVAFRFQRLCTGGAMLTKGGVVCQQKVAKILATFA